MKRIFAVFTVILIALFLCSCSAAGLLLQGVSQVLKAKSGIQQNTNGADYWRDIPSSIPKFNYGTFQTRSSFKETDKKGTHFMMTYTGVSKQDLNDYADALKSAGFDVSTMDDSNGYSVMGSPMVNSTEPPMDTSSPDISSIPKISITGNWVNVNLMKDGDCMVNVDIYASAESAK